VTAGGKVLGAKAVLRQHWDDSPRSHEPRRQLAPRVAAKNKCARIEALTRNRSFIEAYRMASSAVVPQWAGSARLSRNRPPHGFWVLWAQPRPSQASHLVLLLRLSSC
jgi:hypothetical protein